MGGGGGGGLAYVVIQRCATLFKYLFWSAPGFWVPLWAIPRFFGYVFGLFPDFGVSCFLVKFDFFRNNPDIWVLIY